MDRVAVLAWALLAAGWLVVAGTAAWFALSFGAFALAGGAVFVALATTALVGAWQRSIAQPIAAVLGLGASALLAFSLGGPYFAGMLLVFLGSLPSLRARVTPRTGALVAGAVGVLAALPALGGIAAIALDPCGSVQVEPWGATSGSGSASPTAQCPSMQGTSVRLDSLVALGLLFLGGVASLAASLRPSRRDVVAAASAPFVGTMLAAGMTGFPLALIALLALGMLWLPRRPATLPSSPASLPA